MTCHKLTELSAISSFFWCCAVAVIGLPHLLDRARSARTAFAGGTTVGLAIRGGRPQVCRRSRREPVSSRVAPIWRARPTVSPAIPQEWQAFAGGSPSTTVLARSIPPYITADKGTGIGSWTRARS